MRGTENQGDLEVIVQSRFRGLGKFLWSGEEERQEGERRFSDLHCQSAAEFFVFPQREAFRSCQAR
jgi:hypothetical protein